MSENKDETIKDIVREMRGDYDHSDMVCYGEGGELTLETLADRIEVADNNACEQCKMLADAYKGIAELKEENARLKSALKPVLECRSYGFCVDGFSGDYEGYVYVDARFVDKITGLPDIDTKHTNDIGTAADCCNAVREANRIYREGEVK